MTYTEAILVDWHAVVYFVIGGVIGYIAAYRQHRPGNGAAVVEREQHKTSEKIRQWALLIIVLVCAGSAFYYAGSAQTRLDQVDAAQTALDDDQADFERQTDCQQELIANTIDALKSRSLFAEQQAKVQLDLAEAQLVFLSTPQTVTEAERAEAFEVYVKALKTSIQSVKEQLRVRVDNPYPTLDKVRSCE